MNGYALAVAVAVVVVASAVWGWLQRSWRARMRQWADDNGWSFMSWPSADWDSRLPGGNLPGVRWLLSSTISGWPVAVGQRMDTPAATGFRPRWRILVVVKLRGPLPDLAVERRPSLSRLVRTSSGTGDQDTAFHGAYRVVGDPSAAARLITPALMAEHMAGTVPPWSLHGDELRAYHDAFLKDCARIPGLVAPLLRVVDHLVPQWHPLP